MKLHFSLRHVALPLALIFSDCCSAGWLTRVETSNGACTISVPDDGTVYFLEFDRHSYAPDGYFGTNGVNLSGKFSVGEPIPIALFQGLSYRAVKFPDAYVGQVVQLKKTVCRDEFWDQIITVTPSAVPELPTFELVEVGSIGSVLSLGVRRLQLSGEQRKALQQNLVDPHIPSGIDHELSWSQLESLAYPLDFQKTLVASPHDSSPGFVFQNGQWLTTWLSRDLPKWTKEDHWFAPALLIGQQLVRPAPLSAQTHFLTNSAGQTLPIWSLEWQYEGITIRQTIFSKSSQDEGPSVYVWLQVQDAPASVQLALSTGRRPNVHYWDNPEHERTPIPFFTLPAGYQQRGRQLVDRWDHVVLESAQDFELSNLGPVEMLLAFKPNESGSVYLRTPQTDAPKSASPFSVDDFLAAKQKCEEYWSHLLDEGAQANLPSTEWMKRIDIWKTQLEAITRVHYQGQQRLSYGAYFYQAFFGPEEGWPIVALALWGHESEAQRQVEIMLSAENRSKENTHHQSRNGAFAWYAAEVARLTDDGPWLESIAPALIENADWTIDACKSTKQSGLSSTRGLLPPHIYGGDIRDPATSLYASAVCWKGLSETAEVFDSLGSDALSEHARRYAREAHDLKMRLSQVIGQVVDRSTRPPFLPLALALPTLDGKHEGPYQQVTASRLGNYWNLFASSVLELGLVADDAAQSPNSWLLEYMGNHGGLWAGLPRFHNGLDAAYSIGVIKELISRSTRDIRYRNQALASLQSFFLNAASRNGYTIAEVTGLFPYRLEASSYERLVRESPWNFGMYSAERYIDGHISFTEPLGAAAGEALWLIRNALILETRDLQGELDQGLFLLSTVPSDWFREGLEIKLEDFPTYYGKLSVHVLSRVESSGEIEIKYRFVANSTRVLKKMVVRLAPPGFAPRDVSLAPKSEGTLRVEFSRIRAE